MKSNRKAKGSWIRTWPPLHLAMASQVHEVGNAWCDQIDSVYLLLKWYTLRLPPGLWPSQTYVREEPAVSCRWTGWIWETTGWSSGLQEIYQSFKRNLWNIPPVNESKTGRCQHVTGWFLESLGSRPTTMPTNFPGTVPNWEGNYRGLSSWTLWASAWEVSGHSRSRS